MASLKPRAADGKICLEKLTKELFYESIVDSRQSCGSSVENISFNKKRCRVLTSNEKIKEKSTGVVYWMSRDCRVDDNWALLFAQKVALKHNLSLFVSFNFFEAHYLYPTKRQFNFLLKGLEHVRDRCKENNIGFYLLNTSPKGLAEIVKSNNLGCVVCDFSPLRKPVEWQQSLVKALPADVPLVQVDAHNIVPAWEASNKQEVMARTIRPKINNKLSEYLTGFPSVCKQNKCEVLKIDKNEILDFKNAHTVFKSRWDVEEVKSIEAGPEGGLEILRTFLVKRLKRYGISSNDPSKDSSSSMSIWLHFGHVSPQRAALEVDSLKGLYKEQVDRYLEELIVRRELTDNYCLYNENYDNINGAAKWAIETLNAHKNDKRTWTYTREQLNNALTHDEMWNAAQLQMNQEGKIHNYMRMYWCKKILEWTESPEQAIEYALWLNDTFGLDGSDPNGFVGVMWSICGVHDQGWREREIFGKIRFMVDYSLRKKFDMDAYCARYGRTLSNGKGKKGIKRKAK